ncbi:VanW family protein [Ammoniphilus resinae]|uniref:G5 domain-containing protein n=1 Tax=Ammoniphilus resinae TaxID=861532 RepID=A0ABS4GJX8_9BACL|nr:VanW family protein [Ammoniphilus resinae]MBP1930220.1 hypothetical protein [Ammoniphilus resinae]
MEQVRAYAKPYVVVFLILILSVSLLVGFSHSSVFGIKSFVGEFQFASGATIGAISVEGLNRREATVKVEKAVENWLGEPSIQLSWNGKDSSIYPSVFQFDIPTSIEQASSTGSSPLKLTILHEALENNMSQLLDKDIMQHVDYLSLEKAMEDLAVTLPVQKSLLNLSDYLEKESSPSVVIGKNTVSNQAKQPVDLQIFAKLNNYTIEPGESVSLLTLMGKNQFSEAEHNSLNLAAAGIYQLLLHTNLEMIERHIGRTKPAYTDLGFEASIIPNHWDLVFKNPNPGPYTLRTVYQNDQLTVSLEGAKLSARYQPFLLAKKGLEPKTIVHFNSNLSVGEKVTVEKGELGYHVEVYRQKWEDGKLVGKEWISEDYYPPIHRVEEWGPASLPASESIVNPSPSSDQQEEEATPQQVNDDLQKDASKESGWIMIK